MSKHNIAAKEYRLPRTPRYKQIEADMRAKVRDGHWVHGAMLPSRRALAEEYQVDLRTLQEAIVHLLADGTLHADSRRGTYVAQPSAAASHIRSGDEPGVAADMGSERAEARLPGSQFRHVSLKRRPRAEATLGIIAVSWPSGADFSSYAHAQSDWSNTIVSSIQQAFSDAGGACLFVKCQDYDRKRRGSISEAVDQLLESGAKAIAFVNVVNACPSDIDEIAGCIERERIPMIVLAWHEIIGMAPHVINDDVNGGYQAGTHLLASGYGPIIAIDPYQTHWSRYRVAGAREALAHAGLAAGDLLVNPSSGVPEGTRTAESDRDEAAAYLLAKKALRQVTRNSIGIVAANDTAAFGVIRASEEAGLVIGRDIGIVGFDDMVQSAAFGLTSLRPPFEAMGQEVGELLLRALDGRKIPHQVRLSPKLLARASTRRVGVV